MELEHTPEPAAKASILYMVTKTHSEALFEAYLETQGVSWDHEPDLPGKAKRPDYRVQHGSRSLWFEVKEFDDPAVRPTGGFSPVRAIREKIEQARKQFKEYKNDCCALVLHNCESIYRSTHLEAVLSAAFGKYFRQEARLDSRLADEPFRFSFYGSSKLSAGQNTSISAIIILQHYQVDERWVSIWNELHDRQACGEKLPPGASLEAAARMQDRPQVITHANSVRVVVLENPYARIRFPNDLFNGPLDQRWGNREDCYTLLWVGPELQKLRERPEPVPFLLL